MTEIRVGIASRAAEIPSAVWQSLCPGGHPFINPQFFRIIEETGVAVPKAGWQALHLVATRGDVIVGLMPMYLKSHSFGDFIHDWNWEPVFARFGHEYYPRLVAGLPHTPVCGPRFLVAPADPAPAAIRAALIAAAGEIVAENRFSSWHAALAAPNELDALESAGLLLSHDVQFHWSDSGFGDFDGYLASFAAEKRRKVRAERRRATESGLAIEVRRGDEIPAREWPTLHAIYKSTFDRFGNYAALTVECLESLAATLGSRMVVFTAKDGSEAIALSLCFRSDDTLYGRYWGALRPVDSLHFELCFYQGIAYCLREGLSRFEPGAGGEHKIARGFTPTTIRSAHWVHDPAMRRLIAPYLARQQGSIDAYREDAHRHLPFRQSEARP